MIHRVLPSLQRWPLHGVSASRQLERAALAACEAHTLMAAAGLATARLALAIAPRGRSVWVLAGPGNNGGDGLVAARHLHRAGLQVQVSLIAETSRLPADAQHALQQAQAAGVAIEAGLRRPPDLNLIVDALLGLGTTRAATGEMLAAIRQANTGSAPVLSVDLPSGLSADTGTVPGPWVVRADHTLSLLSLKPGLFTGIGRDHAGTVWFDDLGWGHVASAPDAWLGGVPSWPWRQHGQHKGSFGQVLVIGGAKGMGGAVLLAARAALTAGAGRVYLARLDAETTPLDAHRPELMPRDLAQALDPPMLQSATVVCGCGGGTALSVILEPVLHHAGRLVLDADALNAVAADPALAAAVAGRAGRGLPTVLTPHPLEAARLLGQTTNEVQGDRLAAAAKLCQRFNGTVVLKGSGSIVAAPGSAPVINATGNARLGTAGSGDVLAGWLGGLWAQQAAEDGLTSASQAVWLHGQAAETGDRRLPLRAADLIDRMAQALPRT